MAKILLAFCNGIKNKDDPHAMPCFYESFIKGLREQGNSLLVFQHDRFIFPVSKLPREVKEEIDAFDPDCAILFNNAFYDLSRDYDFPICIYEVDSVRYYGNIPALKAQPDRFRYIVPQRMSIQSLRDVLGVDEQNVCYVPFFTSVRNEPREKTMNISFIGSRFSTSTIKKGTLWNAFMKSNPSPENVALYRDALRQIADNPCWTQQDIDSRFAGFGLDTASYLPVADCIMTLSGVRRLQVLSAVADLGLTIYGTSAWVDCDSDDPLIPLSFNRKQVYSIQHNQDIYNASLLSINVNHLQAVQGFSWRVCDIMASSACLVSEYKEDLVRNFPNVPIPTFTNQYEARDICRKLLESKDMREDVMGRCNEAIDAGYRFEHILPVIEDFLQIPLSSADGRGSATVTVRRLKRSSCRTGLRRTIAQLCEKAGYYSHKD